MIFKIKLQTEGVTQVFQVSFKACDYEVYLWKMIYWL